MTSRDNSGHGGTQALAWWRGRLAGFDGPTRLGHGAVRAGPGPVPWEESRIIVDGAGYARLAGTWRDPAAMYPALLAALCVCLARFSGRRTVSAGAVLPWPDPAGPAIALLADVRDGAPFAGLVRTVTEQLSATRELGPDVIDGLCAGLGLTAEPGRHPLFTVGCVLTNLAGPAAGPRCDAWLELTDDGGHLTGALRFDPRVIEAAEAAALCRYFTQILEQAAADPGSTIACLGALSQAEYQTIVVDWNKTAVPAGPELLVHRMVEATAAAQPGAVALLTEGGACGYAELNTRANQLASYLAAELLVKPGDIVAVAVPRSVGLVVSLLAVLKCGAGYLPVDPAHPADRIRLMLDDARPAALVTLAALLPGLPATACPALCLDDAADALTSRPGGNPTCDAHPDGVLCVIYTSGSSGRPKGVLLTHRGIANSLRWEQTAYGLRPGDRLLHLASSAFSLAVVEIFSPLCSGATVVLAPPASVRDSATIAALVDEYAVTVLSVVPAELKLLLETESAMPWTRLRCVITGADTLPRRVHDRYFATCPSLPLLNIYGQTESAVDGTCWTCRPGIAAARVPVGRPIANARAYLLDDDLRPVPVGVPGVLFSGGDGLALGYLGRPDLTAERFVPSPFGPHPGSRLYRSGDVARWLPDGTIELLGREDNQVELAGVRVELEEIEAVLRGHPAVREAAVALHQVPEPAGQGAPRSRAQWEALLALVDQDVIETQLAIAEADRAAQADRR